MIKVDTVIYGDMFVEPCGRPRSGICLLGQQKRHRSKGQATEGGAPRSVNTPESLEGIFYPMSSLYDIYIHISRHVGGKCRGQSEEYSHSLGVTEGHVPACFRNNGNYDSACH